MLGRHADALREKKKALAMDPLSVVIQTDLARMYYFSRDYDQSLEQYRAALDMDPNFGSAHLWLAQVYEQKGLYKEAISSLKTGMHLLSDSMYALVKLGLGYAIAGRCDEARTVLNQLNASSSKRYASPYDIALVHLSLQEKDEAFTWLQRALEQRSLPTSAFRDCVSICATRRQDIWLADVLIEDLNQISIGDNRLMRS
jgi:tetratricopeptide (TPR) repeat protein